jgi:hypothetical protein
MTEEEIAEMEAELDAIGEELETLQTQAES